MQYALPAGLFIGVLFFFWGISTLLSPSGSSVEERMARYAGGQPAQPEVKSGDSKKKRSGGRKDLVDPFATLSGDAADKKFSTKVQRDLARANLKLRVAEYYHGHGAELRQQNAALMSALAGPGSTMASAWKLKRVVAVSITGNL